MTNRISEDYTSWLGGFTNALHSNELSSLSPTEKAERRVRPRLSLRFYDTKCPIKSQLVQFTADSASALAILHPDRYPAP